MIESLPEGLTDGDGLIDPFNWLCHHALRIQVAPAYAEETGYLVASHTLDLRAQPEFRDAPPIPLTSLPLLFQPADDSFFD